MSIGVELRTTSPGVVRYPASAEHTLNVHAGSPVRVACHGASSYSVRTRGQINLLPAGLSDEWTEDDPGASVDVRVPPSLVRTVAEDMGLDPDRATIEPRFHFRDEQLAHVAWALEAESRAGFPNGALYREGLGVALAVHLLSRYRAMTAPRGGLSRQQLERVTEHIEAHLEQELSVPRLARVAAVSTSHFKTLFKLSTGLPVHEYVIRRRVERAKTLLLKGDRPASQIALDSGFSHQSHMARWVRRVLGVTPASIARARR